MRVRIWDASIGFGRRRACADSHRTPRDRSTTFCRVISPHQSDIVRTVVGRPGFCIRAAVYGMASALVIAIPTRLVPNRWFRRMTPTRPQDYVFLVVSSVLIGLLIALRSAAPRRVEAHAFGAGMGTLFAVGCPVCNKLVVALLGTGGALSVFAPLQPLLALAAIAVLVFAIRGQINSISASACPIDGGIRQ